LTITVEDRFEITQVLARYGHVMDRREVVALPDIFTTDATFDVSSVGGPVYRGLSQLEDFLALGDSIHPPFHVLANAWVFQEGGAVRSLSKWLTIDAHTGLPRSGDYHDEWLLTADGWRISTRVARVRWTGGAWIDGYDRE
jgi:SnoaL-like domain